MHNRLVLAGTFVLILGACKAKESAVNTQADSTTTAAAAPAASTPNVVTVHAKDFAFAGPAQIPAGMTTIHLINDGPNIHHVELVRLDSGKTLKDLETALALPATPPSWAVFVGGPNAPDPTKESSATLDLKPGTYAMICLVDVPGGVPHFAKGMIAPLTVTAAPAGATAAAPTPDMTISLSDYAFDLSTPLTAGKHVIEVKNTATQMHEVELVRLAPGKTLEQFMTWMAKPAGPPPGSAIGGVSPFTGAPNYFDVDITPGNYALICFVPDAKDGKPHFMHGMTKAITVM